MSTKFHSLTISSIDRLTDDAIGVTFDVPEHLKDLFVFKQGQYLTLKTMIDNKDVRRPYSICSGVVEQKLQVGIKCIEGGCFSTFAKNEFKVGMTVEVMPPQGNFFTELSPQSHNNYLFIAVGSGVTPILSHIESILAVEPNAEITFVYGNKTPASSMFGDRLTLISQANEQRFKWINVYSQAQQSNELLNGRISAKKITDFNSTGLININAFDCAFFCGPHNMITELISSLKTFGLTDEQLFYELFYLDESDKVANKTDLTSSVENDVLSEITVILDSSNTTFSLSKTGDNILDAAIEQGADLIYSCKVGVCSSCKGKVLQGEVEMIENHSLSDEEVEEGFVLACQAHPISDEVIIDFDVD